MKYTISQREWVYSPQCRCNISIVPGREIVTATNGSAQGASPYQLPAKKRTRPTTPPVALTVVQKTKRAQPGQRLKQIVAILKQEPLTTSEIAQRLCVGSPSTAYSFLSENPDIFVVVGHKRMSKNMRTQVWGLKQEVIA